MGRKVYNAVDSDEKLYGYAFYCPGCGFSHAYFTEKRNEIGAMWTFNGNVNNPTFRASLLNTVDDSKGKPLRCHLFVTNGKIEYCKDCTHHLAGKTVEMEDID